MTEVVGRQEDLDRLARLLVDHSCRLRGGERALIQSVGVPADFVVELVKSVRRAGASPFVIQKDDRVIRETIHGYGADEFEILAEHEASLLARMDATILCRAFDNVYELDDMPDVQRRLALQHYIGPVHLQQRNLETRWVSVRLPTPAMAQRAKMSSETFARWYFDACFVDYEAMRAAMQPLAERLDGAEYVRIVGPADTDLTFSVAGMDVRCETGEHNLPDGEVSTVPVRDSATGRIRYNVPSFFMGRYFEGVTFDFDRGRIDAAVAERGVGLTDILDTDEGARFLGEFAIGLNSRIDRWVGDVLMDEKMSGSLHVTPGNAYEECDNGNRSAVHWDLVLSQREEHGGGQMYLDGELIRDDGVFVPSDLRPLNQI